MINDYMSLSSRRGFNKSVGHVRLVTGIVAQIASGANLAEIIDDLEKSKEVEKAQIGPILNAIVVDREGYSTISFNLPIDMQGFERIAAEVEKWNRFQIIIAYHHPQLGITLINPKMRTHWESVRELNRDELVVVYLKAMQEGDRNLETDALREVRNLFFGRQPGNTAAFGGLQRPTPPAPPPKPAAAPAAPRPAAQPMPQPSARPAAAAPAAAPAKEEEEEASAPPPPPDAGGKRKVTPKYSVQVTNELFHNGNVEAWKNIVESYKSKHPGLDVHIFHDGQRVNNINALFKWGKVKHGDAIVFCVSGEEIKGVAKLQRYLFEGASIRYSNYLKKDVNKVLNLF